MSRPAMTTGPPSATARCLATIASRTPGWAATVETTEVTSAPVRRVGHVRAVDRHAIAGALAGIGDDPQVGRFERPAQGLPVVDIDPVA